MDWLIGMIIVALAAAASAGVQAKGNSLIEANQLRRTSQNAAVVVPLGRNAQKEELRIG